MRQILKSRLTLGMCRDEKRKGNKKSGRCFKESVCVKFESLPLVTVSAITASQWGGSGNTPIHCCCCFFFFGGQKTQIGNPL